MRTLKFKRYTKGQTFNPETAERDTLHFVVIKDSPLVVNVYDVDAKGNVALISGEDVTKVLNGFREKSVDSWTEITGLNNNENSIITLTHNRGRYIVNSSKNSLKIVGFHLMPDSGVYDGMPISIKNNSQGPITIDSIPNPDSIYHIIDSDILPMQIEKGYTAMFAFNFDSKTVELIKTSEKGPTKTSDLTNDGEDGSYPYLTVQDINWVVSKVGINEIDDNYAWSVESASGRSFKMTDYDSIMINHNGNRIEIDENDMLYMTAHDNIKAYTPYFEVEGEFNVILGSSSSKFFRFNEAIKTTVTAPRTIYTDGTNVKYTGNDGVPRDLAFASDIKTDIFNPPTLAQLTALNIKRGDFYKNINTGQIALFDGEQLTEWIITSVTQWNSLTPEQKAAVKIFSYQKDE